VSKWIKKKKLFHEFLKKDGSSKRLVLLSLSLSLFFLFRLSNPTASEHALNASVRSFGVLWVQHIPFMMTLHRVV